MTVEQTKGGEQRHVAGGDGRQDSPAFRPPGPEMMLGLWTSWVEAASKLAGGPGASEQGGSEAAHGDRPMPWQMSPDQITGGLLQHNVRQLGEMLAKDPILRAAEAALNANPLRQVIPVDWAEIVRALRTVWLRSMSHPEKAMAAAADLNMRLWQSAMDTWNEAAQRWLGLARPDTPPPGQAPPGGDKRFAAPEWQSNPAYRMFKDLYLLASDWLLRQASDADDLSPAERHHLEFHLRQFVDAMSPALLLAANPVALRRAMETGGTSLADGVRNLTHDIEQGRLTMVDDTAFAPGRNLALTPGKVVYRNKLIELIQYSPATDTVHQVPLMLIPPWINKYYIMDMQPKNSMVRFLVSQGFTVFMLSWRNPDASMEGTTIEDYMDLGPLAASDAIREITGSQTVNVMGYCIGGTLLALTLAWLAAKGGDRRFGSATFMVSLLDFTKVGDTAVFLGEPTVDFIEQQMMQRGYLDSSEMSNMFNLLRSNDLIWSTVVNSYLLGQKPPAFDLLYWNSDGTRMARAAHTWYLRNTYAENNLMHPGKIHLKGEALDLGRIRLDVYAVGAEKDHIVPWDAAWRITQLIGGRVRFVLASSGHIAGMINPPGGKGTYSTGEGGAETAAQWHKQAERHDGSWWTDWSGWLGARGGEQVKPPTMGSAAHPPLQDAPGSYVLET